MLEQQNKNLAKERGEAPQGWKKYKENAIAYNDKKKI